MEKFINPFTDFGFKKLFGEEVNRDLLIDFLNELLRGTETIQNLTYLKNEHLPNSPEDRKAIFDLYCENERGQKFIVELQKVKQKFFKDRSIYYATFPIQEQANTGDWNFELKAVYTIAIMDFIFDDHPKYQHVFHHKVKMIDEPTGQVFLDKIQFIYLEMPKFNKSLSDLNSHYEKWLYLLKNLGKLQQRPTALQEKVFQRLLDTAEIARFDPKERQKYIDSVKAYRDLKNSMDTYFEKGIKEGEERGMKKGKEEGKAQEQKAMILAMFQNQISLAQIAQITGKSIEEIKDITKEQ